MNRKRVNVGQGRQNKIKKIRALVNTRSKIPALLRSRKAEMKTIDVDETTINSTISTTATFVLLNGTIEGASYQNRIGRKIAMESVRLTGQIVPSGNGAGVSEYMRIMIIYDRQTNGAFPAITDVLETILDNGTTTNTSYSGLNMNNAERFFVLMDQRVHIANNNVSTVINTSMNVQGIVDSSSFANIDRFKKLKNLETHYKAAGIPNATVGDIATGGLYLVTFGNVASATSGYKLVASTRVRYSDI